MRQVAGDFYEFIELSESRFGVLVADVTGHGVAAALVASMMKAAMLIMRGHADDPAELLANLNTVFCNQLEGQFITAIYAVFDSGAQKVRFSGAGHPAMLQWQSANGEGRLLESNGLPLGMFADAQYPMAEADFHPGDRVLLYTDGLPEAADAREEQFGQERMQSVLSREVTAAGIVDKLIHSVREWRGGSEMDDDLTALAVVNTSQG
jgi:serine phosphatase RsbU (regulator of sigma subunit)